MDMITISAKTLDEAITKALLELQTTSEHLYYEVVQKESSGFLGIFGGKQCVIRAWVMGEEEEKNKKEEEDKRVRIIEEKAKIEAKKLEKARIEKKEKEELEKNQNSVKDGKTVKSEERIVVEKTTEKLSEELKTEKVSKKYSEQRDSEKKKYERKDGRADGHEKTDRRNIELHEKSEPRMRAEVKMDEAVVQRKAKEFLDQIFNAMGMQVSIETSVNVEEGELQVMMAGDDMGILIGKRGQTLDSLQYLVSLVVNKETEGYLRVKLDTENYRERRKETLETLARNISYKVKRTKKPVSLEPMNPYERRIIHSALQNDRYVVTRSEGEDPYRHVVISLKRENYNRRDRYSSRKDGRDNRNREKQMERQGIEKTEEGFE